MKTPEFNPNELNKNPLEESLESKRIQYAEKVKLELEKHQDEIKDFSLLTTSKKANGGFGTNDRLPPVSYLSNYDSEYEFFGLPRDRNYIQERKSGYVLDTRNSLYTFIGPLGRALHTPDRPGNSLVITLKAEKGKLLPKELIDSINDVVNTMQCYENGEVYEDLKNIAIQGLPVLEAFEGLSEKFSSTGHISVKSMIEEYKQIIEKGE